MYMSWEERRETSFYVPCRRPTKREGKGVTRRLLMRQCKSSCCGYHWSTSTTNVGTMTACPRLGSTLSTSSHPSPHPKNKKKGHYWAAIPPPDCPWKSIFWNSLWISHRIKVLILFLLLWIIYSILVWVALHPHTIQLLDGSKFQFSTILDFKIAQS